MLQTNSAVLGPMYYPQLAFESVSLSQGLANKAIIIVGVESEIAGHKRMFETSSINIMRSAIIQKVVINTPVLLINVSLKCLHFIDVLTDRLKVYTKHPGCWSYLFNFISGTFCTTFMFLLF